MVSGATNSRFSVNPYGSPPAIQFAAGSDHSLALAADGTVWAWGGNSSGQLGDGTVEGALFPFEYKILRVSSQSSQEIGTRWRCVAMEPFGPGVATITVRSVMASPRARPSQGRYLMSTISSRLPQELCIPWRWEQMELSGHEGYNSSGQLGDGNQSSQFTPVATQNVDNVIAIAAGSTHSMALDTSGAVWAWGDNFYGQLGDGSRVDRGNPVQVRRLNDVSSAIGHSTPEETASQGSPWARVEGRITCKEKHRDSRN